MDLLWKKEPNTGLYVDIFKDVPAEFRDSCFERIFKKSIENKTHRRKNNQISSNLYEKGNKIFRTNDWVEAMKLYNASLCFAEINSDNVCLAYAKRSECFLRMGMFKKCLIDIELAKQANYPTRLMPNLEKLHEYCIKLMNSNDEFDEFVPELSYTNDANFPGMANVLQIKYDTTFGRHIIATNDIPAGKTILVEEAFSLRLIGIQRNNCSACLKITMNFIACENCTNALFCDSICANANNFHNIECKEHAYDTKSPNEFYMRSILTAMSIFENTQHLMNFVEMVVNDKIKTAPITLNDMKSKYRALLQLSTFASVKNKKLYFQQAFVIYNSLILLKTINKQFNSLEKKRFLMHLVLHHDIVISINNFRSENYSTTEDEGAFIICSYFNHACAPNLMVKRTGRIRYCITTRPIKTGKQLYVTYFGDLFCEKTVQDCQEYLYKNYGFRCKCERCRCKANVLSKNSLIVSDPAYQYLCREQLKAKYIAYNVIKLIHMQETFVDLLNRYGEHWCEELDTVIEDYETISDEIVLRKTLPLCNKSFGFYYRSLIVLIVSIFLYIYLFQMNQ